MSDEDGFAARLLTDGTATARAIFATIGANHPIRFGCFLAFFSVLTAVLLTLPLLLGFEPPQNYLMICGLGGFGLAFLIFFLPLLRQRDSSIPESVAAEIDQMAKLAKDGKLTVVQQRLLYQNYIKKLIDESGRARAL